MPDRKRIPRKFSIDYMNNVRVRTAIDNCVNLLESENLQLSNVDRCYSELSKEILWEMNKFKKIGKRQHTPFKPYWNANLSVLWLNMRRKYDAARTEMKSLNRKQLKRMAVLPTVASEYVQSQQLFDKELRNAKRNFDLNSVIDLENLSNTKNPKDFWREVNKLGPRSKKELVCEAVDSKGNITRNKEIVTEFWKDSFTKLYGDAPAGQFDDAFLRERKLNLTINCQKIWNLTVC